MFSRNLLVRRFVFCNAYSTLITNHPQDSNVFSHFASTRFNLSEVQINRMIKRNPALQRLQTLDRVERFAELLNRYGCSDLQVAKMMTTQPNAITLNTEKILEPKIKLFEDFGFQGETLSKLLMSNTRILCSSLENDLSPKMKFFKNLFRSQQSLIKFTHRVPAFFLTYSLEKRLKPSVAFWESWGFQGTELVQLILINPTILQRTSLTPAQVDLIHDIGADKESNGYKYIVSLVATSRLEKLRDKIENLRRWGLSAEETWQLCRARVLRFSKVRVSETINFVVKDMGFPPNFTVKHPSLFDANLKKIIWPRFQVWQKIKSMNGPSLSFLSIVKMTESRFVNNIIRHSESTALLAIYEEAMSKAANRAMSSLQC